MVALPQKDCPTLQAADAALVAAQDRKLRRYLGMSAIGNECARQLWYHFRWVRQPNFDAATLKRFADGHATEAAVVARLKAVDCLEVYDVGEDGSQFGFTDLGGHFSGHMDGVIKGLLQAPSTWHVLEVKATAEKKLAELKKAIREVGEKNALRRWNSTYYAQAVLYMDYAGLDRHYTVVATPGARDWAALRTEADPAEAMRLRQLADRIIFSDVPPERIGGPDFWLCGWCEMGRVCHAGELPERNCRTCLHSTPEREQGWSCAHWNMMIDDGKQRVGCEDQRFLPVLVGGQQVDAHHSGVTYRMPDGATWTDRGQVAA